MSTPEALNALADRVEREEPSFELDSTIYEDALPVEEKRRIVDLPAYTTSLDAHVRPEGDDVFWRSGHDAEGPDPSLFKAEVLLSNLGRSFKGIARTEAMARRAAELRARAADMQARAEDALRTHRVLQRRTRPNEHHREDLGRIGRPCARYP